MLNQFDEITRFRIINAIAVYFGLNILVPVIADLRGELLSPTMISIIMIALTVSVKLNEYITRFSISTVFKLGNIFHALLTVSTFIYFINPLLFVYTNAFLGIIEVAIFTSYSIQLDEYLAKKYSGQVAKFKIYTNSKKADATLLGLGLTALMTALLPLYIVFIIFIVYNAIFSFWLFWNWRFFDIREKELI
jgi:hypothetical protein